MGSSEKLNEEPVSSTAVFRGNLLKVFSDRVRLPDGSESTREYITHPGASAILPVFENGDVMLVEQYRYPLGKVFREVPAGKIDPEENPSATALRELEEETGLKCRHYQELGHFHPSIGYTDEIIHLYTGWGLSHHGENTETGEFLRTRRCPFAQALDQVLQGTITDSKTIITLLKSYHWWKEKGPFQIESL